MVRKLDSGLSGQCFDCWPGCCIVFLGKTSHALYSHSASLHPGVQMKNDEII